MVNDDLACETSSNGIVRECVLDGVLDSADCQSAAVIIACTKAYYKKFILADLILISCVIHGSVSCIVVFLVLFCSCCLCGCSLLSCCLCNGCGLRSCCRCCRCCLTSGASGKDRHGYGCRCYNGVDVCFSHLLFSSLEK